MKVLSLDCEYNQPSGKTIQIGAGVYDVKSGQLIEKFEVYVRPGEPINVEITILTGIKDSDVSGGISILEAYHQLKSLHEKHHCFVNPLVWGSGVRNDSQHIYDESESQDSNFMGYRVLDVKTIYQSIQMSKNTTVRGGLKKSCEKAGIGFEGEAHTAFADAHNTFRLWFHLMKQFNPLPIKGGTWQL
jgi:inhibitor of KinA sporulation pathway (predicted exonuclease)